MRIAYTSDLHIDASVRNHEAVRLIADHIEALEPDVVVIAGDAGNTLDDLDAVFSCFDRINVPRLFVAGNHDVWIETAGGVTLDSREKYSVRIPDVCRRHGFDDLGQEPTIIDDVGFVGSLGWYDYSFADPRLALSEDAYWEGKWGEEIWWDKEMAFWPSRGNPSGRLRDPEVCGEMASALDKQLRMIEDQVERVVAVVHTLPFLETLPRSTPPYYLDAFTGADCLGKMLLGHPKVTRCIGGHKHLAGDWAIGGIHAHRRPLARVPAEADVDGEARKAIGVIDLSGDEERTR